MPSRGYRAIVAVSLLAIALVVACGGGSNQPAATATVTHTPRPAHPLPTATPSAVATFTGSIPPLPTRIEDYPAAIASYLNKVGNAALGEHCLADLLAAWQMPNGRGPVPPGTSLGQGRCVLGNTDADPEKEVVVSLSAQKDESAPLSTQLVVFDHAQSGWQVAYLSTPGNGKTDDVPFAILATGDLTGDGIGDLAYAEISCGAHTCTWFVHVVSGTDSGYRALTPPDGLSLTTADVRIEDTAGDGTKEIIMHGGIIQSVGAGPQRAATDVYAWDGTQYSLRSMTNDASDLRYFNVRDADDAFAVGDFSAAQQLYVQALTDPSLKDVGSLEGKITHDELLAYSRFRLGLSYLELGDTSAASDQVESAIANYPASLVGQAALAFRNAANLTRAGIHDLSSGCKAAIAFANQNINSFRASWDYGYANPGFDSGKFCPF